MEYVGVGPEEGNRVGEIEAFDYALERGLHGSIEDQVEFREGLIEWFYSGNWVFEKNPHNDLQTVFIQRCSDGYMSAHSSYIEAFRAALEHIDGREMTFVIVE